MGPRKGGILLRCSPLLGKAQQLISQRGSALQEAPDGRASEQSLRGGRETLISPAPSSASAYHWSKLPPGLTPWHFWVTSCGCLGSHTP